MNVLTITIYAKLILKSLDKIVTWARIVLNPKDSRFLIFKKEKVTKHVKMSIHGERIPSMNGNRIKCLGNCSIFPLRT